jgi:hypothetical protein
MKNFQLSTFNFQLFRIFASVLFHMKCFTSHGLKGNQVKVLNSPAAVSRFTSQT